MAIDLITAMIGSLPWDGSAPPDPLRRAPWRARLPVSSADSASVRTAALSAPIQSFGHTS
eukprot:8930612-Alexandrium_andersonii.AAC.1